jgi:hypothetical protein
MFLGYLCVLCGKKLNHGNTKEDTEEHGGILETAKRAHLKGKAANMT